MGLCLGMDEEPNESLWVRIKGRGGTGDIVVQVCYRPPNQEDQTDKALCRQVEVAPSSQALVLMRVTSTTPVSSGRTTPQQGTSNPRVYRIMLMITSFSK